MKNFAFIVALVLGPHAVAQADPVPERLAEWASQSADLEFPARVSSFGAFSSPQMAVYKPDGPGPFPALVLQHQCGGLGVGRQKFSNTSMLEWAKRAVDRGYVALLMDSLGPRGVDTVCLGFKGGVNWGRGLKDVQQAAIYLRALDYVDKERVALAGYSWGGGIGLLASSRRAVETLNVPGRFNAVVAFYPPCYIRPRGRAPYELIVDGIDRPVLVLLGGQDNETPPQECIDRLEPLKRAGSPVELHTYPQATHCWDCKSLDGFRKTDVRGNAIVYHYDEALTRDLKPLREGSEIELVLRPGYRRITYNPIVDMLTEGRALSLTHRSLMFQCTVVWQVTEGGSGARVLIRGVFKGIQPFLLARIGRDHLYRLILHHNLRDLRRIAEKMV